MVVASFVFSVFRKEQFMDTRERLLAKEKIDIMRSINKNLIGINKRLGEIETTLKVNGFAVIPTVLAEEIENAKENN